MSYFAESKCDKIDSVTCCEIALYSRITVVGRLTAANKSIRPTIDSNQHSIIGQLTENTARPHSNSKVDTPAELIYAEIHTGYAEIAEPYLVERGLQRNMEARSSEVALDDEVTVIENVNFYF